MKQAKQVVAKDPIEYRLLITPKYKEREKVTVTLVALRTITEFTNFQYEIVVEDSVEDRTIQLGIHGLRAPRMSLPKMGPAIFEKEYSDLKGKFTIIVTKLDQVENSFEVSISKTKVVIQNGPQNQFVDIVTRQEDW